MRISDWSSDVCSSDLSSTALLAAAEFARDPALTRLAVVLEGGHGEVFMQPFSRPILADSALAPLTPEAARALLDGRRAIGSGIGWLGALAEIGRASCRERGCKYV